MLVKRTTIRRLGPFHSADESYLRGEGRRYVEQSLDDDEWVQEFRFLRSDKATKQECDEYSDPADGFYIDPDYTIMLVYELDEAIPI